MVTGTDCGQEEATGQTLSWGCPLPVPSTMGLLEGAAARLDTSPAHTAVESPGAPGSCPLFEAPRLRRKDTRSPGISGRG